MCHMWVQARKDDYDVPAYYATMVGRTAVLSFAPQLRYQHMKLS